MNTILIYIISYGAFMIFFMYVTQIIGKGSRALEQRFFYWLWWPIIVLAVMVSAPFVDVPKEPTYWHKLKGFFKNELFPVLFNYDTK